MKKLMDAYCARQAVQLNSVRFLFEGKRLEPGHTPKELGMEDNDVIDAMLQQVVRSGTLPSLDTLTDAHCTFGILLGRRILGFFCSQ